MDLLNFIYQTTLSQLPESQEDTIQNLFNQLCILTDSYKYGFFPNAISNWNKLPPEIANTVDSTDFQNSLRSYLQL